MVATETTRPLIVGPESGPEAPYPYKMEGKVISGFGRGSKELYPMVMSIGYNPFYKNTVRSAEVHVLHKFSADFYDAHMRLLILGFVRDELDYKSLEALIADINTDCEVAKNSLARDAWHPPKALRPKGTVDGTLDAKWLVEELPKA
ncbi:riboflavin kinase [Colletotrichum fioriniae]|uniref:riboflavin kinase n=1 Tax=Colletotrichum fioriniae TaxID=710243 RepID=UPI0032DBDF6B|nr:riboflavin kinase [Colletotrichum fioriniae]